MSQLSLESVFTREDDRVFILGGSLELGKVADMVILSENPYTAENIGSIKVEQLILHGEPYRSAKENAIPAILRGLTSNHKA